LEERDCGAFLEVGALPPLPPFPPLPPLPDYDNEKDTKVSVCSSLALDHNWIPPAPDFSRFHCALVTAKKVNASLSSKADTQMAFFT